MTSPVTQTSLSLASHDPARDAEYYFEDHLSVFLVGHHLTDMRFDAYLSYR